MIVKARNETIIEQGSKVKTLYRINSGVVVFERRTFSFKKSIIGFYGAGTHIGLSAYLTDDKIQYTAKCITAVSYEAVETISPNVAVLELREKISSSRRLYTESRTPGMVRFIHLLLDYKDKFGVLQRDGRYKIVGFPNHQQLANALNAQRVTVSRYVADAREAGAIEGTRYEIKIDIDALYEIMDSVILGRM